MAPLAGAENSQQRPRLRTYGIWWAVGIVSGLALVMVAIFVIPGNPAPITYSAFLDQLEAGNIACVTFQGTQIDGLFKHPMVSSVSGGGTSPVVFRSHVPEVGDPTLLPELRKQHVTIDVSSGSPWTWILARVPWPMLLFLGALVVAAVFRLVRRPSEVLDTEAQSIPNRGLMGIAKLLFSKRVHTIAQDRTGLDKRDST